MSASESKRAVIVGIFIFLGLVILIAGVLILGGQQNRFAKNITLYAVFNDVAGLQTGNNVWVSGVKVGMVDDIHFSEGSTVEVEMKIESRVSRYIRKDSKVRISSEGFIGNKLLVISGGSREAPAVENGDRLETVAAVDTDDMMETLQKNNKNLVQITEDLKKVTSNIVAGKGTVGAVLSDSVLADNFRALVADLRSTSANVSGASGDLARLTAKMDQEGTLVHDLLSDTVVFDDLRKSVSELEKTVSAAHATMKNLEQVSTKLDSSGNAVDVLLNDPEFAADLKNTMKNIESSSEKLDENMEALRHNFLFRRYFRKKEKGKL